MADNFPLNIYDKGRLAAVNVARGEPGAAFRTIFKPESLSPTERSDLTGMFGDNPLINAVVDTITNPFVLIGLALNFRWPLKGLPAAKVFQEAQLLKTRASDMSWWTKNFGNWFNITRGLPEIKRAGIQIHDRSMAFSHKHTDTMSKALLNFKRAVGTDLTDEEHALAMLVKQNMHQPNGGELGRGVYGAAKKMLKRNVSGPLVDMAAVKRGMGPERYKAFMAFQKDFAKSTDGMWDDMGSMVNASPEYIAHVESVLATRGLSRGQISRMLTKDSAGRYQLGKYRNEYVPHQSVGNRNLFAEEQVQIRRDNGLIEPVPGAYSAAKVAQTYEGFVSNSLLARQGIMIPELKGLEKLSRKGWLVGDNYTALKDFHTVGGQRMRRAIETVYKTSDEQNLGANLKEMLVRDFHANAGPAEQAAYSAADTMRLHGYDRSINQFMNTAGELGTVGQYNVNLPKVMESYINGMATSYAGVAPAPGAPNGFLNVIREGAIKLNPTSDPRRDILLRDYYVRLAGLPTDTKANQLTAMRASKLKHWELLQKPGVAKVFDAVPGGKRLREHWLKTLADGGSGTWSPAGADAAVTELLYHGALGFNPSAAIKNSSQTLLGTINVIGVKATAEGYAETAKSLPRYLRLQRKYLKQGLSRRMADDMAFRETEPAFTKYGLGSDPMMAAGVNTEGAEFALGAGNTIDAFKHLSMGLFRPSERIQRLIAWYGGQARARATGLTGPAVQEFAAELVHRTQFPSGVLGTPRALLNAPGWLRQFTQFPTRHANFLVESTRYGGGNTRNYGTIGRAMATSGIAYEVGKNLLGLDLSESLMVGGMPSPGWKNSPFYPMPLVPPAVGIVGSAIKAVDTGDYSDVGRSASILVPGGLAASRALRNLSPTRADYHQYKETGKIPVYDNRGFLQGRYTPIQLFLKSIGVRTTNASTETQMTSYLLAQKEKLRDYRREYLQSLARNDVLGAEKIQSQYQQQYPELGPLRVKKSDIRAHRNRQSNSRIERILAGMPKEAQPLFREIASMVQAKEMAERIDQGGEYMDIYLGG